MCQLSHKMGALPRWGLYGVLAALLGWASPASADELSGLVAQARREGLPAAALENKIREGKAKGVPAPRVAQVVGSLLGHLRSAKTWLAKPATKGQKPRSVPHRLLVSVAEARLAGVQQRPLGNLLGSGKLRGSFARRVDALVDLHLRGYNAQRSVELVRGTRLREVAGLGRQADRLRRSSGLSRVQVLDRMSVALRRNTRLRRGSDVNAAGGPSGQGAGPGPGPGGPPPGKVPPTPTQFRGKAR